MATLHPRRTWLLLAAAFLVIGGSASAAAARHDRAAPLTPPQTGPIVIDASVHETFTPSTKAPAGVAVISEAAARRAAGAHALTPPDEALVRTGYLTFPIGDQPRFGYHAKHTFAYAFTWPECGPRMGGINQPAYPVPPPAEQCTAWVIVNAQNAKILDITWS